jgi:predicted ribosome quality control (RQC) complex YloA/Tae2 family protein
MKIRIDYTRSAQDNADQYYRLSKKLKRKAEGAGVAIADLEHKRAGIASRPVKQVRMKRLVEKRWYEKFNWFNTSNSMLAIGGRSAIQNEIINSRHFEANDLFFHADVFGASLVVLKDGVGASREIREEAAQFAACYSKAWESGTASVNVYSLRRDQVSKSKEKGSLGTGSFLLEGEREWFKGVALELCAYTGREDDRPLFVVPISTCMAMGVKRYLLLKPGNVKKSDAAKRIADRLKFEDIDHIMQHLPAGGFSIKEV